MPDCTGMRPRQRLMWIVFPSVRRPLAHCRVLIAIIYAASCDIGVMHLLPEMTLSKRWLLLMNLLQGCARRTGDGRSDAAASAYSVKSSYRQRRSGASCRARQRHAWSILLVYTSFQSTA
ncbi:uncharacterized protein SCHCODRAFT_02045079 [Schizophyllum commune H4-8]|uniref:uncharacterized protein n=1 Tax=Schizophyllum commune (strain H4-8 / FGSC 9210) TaxID=578458 RepID=UPI00215EB6FB|nr:uncharacterized protein SCHCODRAFT_02045079 [Schizophyllum commune H4-8]KAI5900842.1 hypothetical protein SCHCODRAFT_02045079 [Schizophyllum commune H4-8]